jgi:hypothetical protein
VKLWRFCENGSVFAKAHLPPDAFSATSADPRVIDSIQVLRAGESGAGVLTIRLRLGIGAFEDKGEVKRLRLETKLEDTVIGLTVIIERKIFGRVVSARATVKKG